MVLELVLDEEVDEEINKDLVSNEGAWITWICLDVCYSADKYQVRIGPGRGG